MSYYSKSKNELSKIGADGFALLDGFSGGHKSKPSSSSAPPTQPANKLFHYQYQPNPTRMIKQQVVYVASTSQAARTETVVDCYEAAKMYGGTVIVDYPKKKPSRWGFFYR